MSHLDWMPTFAAAAGDTDLKQRILNGTRIGTKEAKLHLDGYSFLPYLTGQAHGPRPEFHYLNDEGWPVGVRVSYWDWMIGKAAQGYLGLATTARFLETFQAYPPSQKPDSWSIDKLTDALLKEK